jgi:hypothetical protein
MARLAQPFFSEIVVAMRCEQRNDEDSGTRLFSFGRLNYPIQSLTRTSSRVTIDSQRNFTMK